MCGIAGILAVRDPNQAIGRMLDALRHRGPDDRGAECLRMETGGFLCLGNTRLAILDLSERGHMPMLDAQTGNLIVYNGEIFNFQDIREQLRQKGRCFLSDTDTEVVLKAYAEWGPSCLERFRGMFAFAVWDAAKRELFIARDRLGIKPLYYTQTAPSSFAFASEIRALVSSGWIPGKLSSAGLDSLLCNGFVLSPATILQDVFSLLPGHYMRVNQKGSILETKPYWNLGKAVGITETNETVLQAFEEAVSRRLISDVPLCVFLSGGLDSSSILAAAARRRPGTRSISIAFEEKAFDESSFAAEYAEKKGSPHSKVLISRQRFLADIDGALSAMDQPSLDGINSYFVCKAAKENDFTVALSGFGSDEVFGGYQFFKDMMILRRLIPALAPLFSARHRERRQNPLSDLHGFWKSREIFGSRLAREYPALAAYQARQIVFPLHARQAFLIEKWRDVPGINETGMPPEFVELLQHDTQNVENPLDKLCRYAIRIFLGERCLRDLDTMSMRHSLEVRAPFTDHIFLSAVLGISSRERCRRIPDKPREYAVMKPLLGPEYVRRRKQGFIFPFETWLQHEDVVRRIEATFQDAAPFQNAGLAPELPSRLYSLYRNAPAPRLWSRVWLLYVFTRWCLINRITAA